MTDTPAAQVRRPLNLATLIDLLRPGLRDYEGRYGSDWRHPSQEFDMRVEKRNDDPDRIVIKALWKDGSYHCAYITEIEEASPDIGALFKQKMGEICPSSYFDDEAIVAYDEPKYW